jgi:DNA-binding MarR family transcriptional regulator
MTEKAPCPPMQKRYDVLVGVAARKALKTLSDCLQDIDINPKHYAVMSLVDSHSMNQITIADTMHINKNVMIRLLDDLERRGMARRESNPSNRREYFIQLTDHGKETLSQADTLVSGAHQSLLEPLTEHEKENLCKLLFKTLRKELTHNMRTVAMVALFAGTALGQCPVQSKVSIPTLLQTRFPTYYIEQTNSTQKDIAATRYGLHVEEKTGDKADFNGTAVTDDVKVGKKRKTRTTLSPVPPRSKLTLFLQKVRFKDGSEWVDDGSHACTSNTLDVH